MANLYFSLPVVQNGVGAAVDISTSGSEKTFVVQGPFTGVLTIELSEDGGTSWFTLMSFTRSNGRTVPVAANRARVRSSGANTFAPFAPEVDIGSNDYGGSFGTIPAPAANGTGVALNITTFGLFTTINVQGDFGGGVIAIEISENGTDFAEIFTFADPGAVSLVVTGDFIRAVSRGAKSAVPFSPVVSIGSVNDAGGASPSGGGGGCLIYQPGGGGAGPVLFEDWADLMTQLATIQVDGGCVEIEIDDSITSPAVIPAGAYNMQYVTAMCGVRDFGATILTVSEGVQFTGGLNTFCNLQVRGAMTATNAIVLANGDAIYLKENADISVTNVASVPFFDAAAVTTNVVIKLESGSSIGLNGSRPIISMPGVTTLNIHAENGTVYTGSYGGAVGTTINIVSSSGADAFGASAFALGTVQVSGVGPRLIPNPAAVGAAAIAAPTTLGANGQFVRASASAGTLALTLPVIPGTQNNVGRPLVVTETAIRTGLTVAPGVGNTIRGLSNAIAIAPGGGAVLVPDSGTNWQVGAITTPPLLLNNVKDFGATGDGTTDDRAAIQAAITDATARGVGGIFFPPGTYSVSKLAGATDASFDINGVTNFTIAGAGPASIIRMAATALAADTWYMWRIRGSSARILFENLVLDGNKASVTGTSILTSLLFVETSTDVNIRNVRFTNCLYVGVKVGSAVGTVARFNMTSCRVDTNSTVGLHLVSLLNNVLIESSFFFGNTAQDILMEPLAGSASSDIAVKDCFLDKDSLGEALRILGDGASVGPTEVSIEGCVIDGEVEVLEVGSIEMADCIISSNVAGAGGVSAVAFSTVADRILFSNNLVLAPNANAVRFELPTSATNIHMDDNLIQCGATFNGIYTESADQLTVEGNLVMTTSGAGDTGILIRATNAVANCAIRNNDVIGSWATRCIRFTVDNAITMEEIMVIANRMEGGPAGGSMDFAVAGTGAYNQKPIIALNFCDTTLMPAGSIANFPEDCYIMGGAANTLNSATQYVGTLATPNGALTGNVGDVYHYLSGSPAVWIKESGNGTNTGWSPSSSGHQLFWGNGDIGAAADTRYLQPGAGQGAALTTDTYPILIPRAGIISRLYVRHCSASGDGDPVAYTVMVNGVASAVTVSLATGAIGQTSDLVNTAAVAAGDRISLRAVKTLNITTGTVDVVAAVDVITTG